MGRYDGPPEGLLGILDPLSETLPPIADSQRVAQVQGSSYAWEEFRTITPFGDRDARITRAPAGGVFQVQNGVQVKTLYLKGQNQQKGPLQGWMVEIQGLKFSPTVWKPWAFELAYPHIHLLYPALEANYECLERNVGTDRFSWGYLLPLCRQLLQVLDEIHQLGFYHGSMSPSSVYLQKAPNDKDLHLRLMVHPPCFEGWTPYWPIEVLCQAEPQYRTEACDIWAFGMVLLFCLKQNPFGFPEENLSQDQLLVVYHENAYVTLSQDLPIPEWLRGLITLSLTRESQERPSAEDLRRRLPNPKKKKKKKK